MSEYGIEYFIFPAVVLLLLIVTVLVLSRGMPFAKKVVSSSLPILIALSLLCVLAFLKIISAES